LQEGAYAAGSFEVTQRAAGVNMSVDIAATTAENGIAALVQGDAVTGQGLYAVAPHSAVINEAITAAHATLPRVDRVILEVLDTTHDASGSNLVRTRVVDGTATAGATLDNLSGVASVPDSALLLADVHVPAADTTISNSQIRDRRKWARGAYCRIMRNTSNYTIASSTVALIDGTNLAPRIECSGAPVRVRLEGVFHAGSGSGVGTIFSPQVDSAGVDGMVSVGGTATLTNGLLRATPQEGSSPVVEWVTTPSAGSHIIAPAWGRLPSGTVTMFVSATQPLIWTIEEIVRQNTKNNATTSG